MKLEHYPPPHFQKGDWVVHKTILPIPMEVLETTLNMIYVCNPDNNGNPAWFSPWNFRIATKEDWIRNNHIHWAPPKGTK